MLIHIFAVIISSWPLASGIELTCYQNYSKGIGCETMDVFEENSFISVVLKNNSTFELNSVAYFEIVKESDTRFMPLNVCGQLTGLINLQIYGKNVEKIAKDIFHHCENVKNVVISGTHNNWLPEDSFDFLINMESLNLSANKIKMIPSFIFSDNKKLREFVADDNPLEVIDVFFEQPLQFVSLKNCACVDEQELRSMFMLEINHVIEENCTSYKVKMFNRSLISLQKELQDMNNKFENFRSETITFFSENCGDTEDDDTVFDFSEFEHSIENDEDYSSFFDNILDNLKPNSSNLSEIEGKKIYDSVLNKCYSFIYAPSVCSVEFALMTITSDTNYYAIDGINLELVCQVKSFNDIPQQIAFVYNDTVLQQTELSEIYESSSNNGM